MELLCQYTTRLQRNDYSGDTEFCVKPAAYQEGLMTTPYGYTYLRGVLQDMPKGTPLRIVCEDEPVRTGTSFYYRLKNYEFTQDPSLVTEFLSSDVFRGIGTKTARKITAKHSDVFKLCEDPEAAWKAFRECGMKESDAQQLALRMNDLGGTLNAMRELSQYGASYSAIIRYYKYETKHGRKCDPRKHPYRMTFAGIPYEMCEFVAVRNGGTQYNRPRLMALANTAYDRGTAGGDTKLSFARFCECCRIIEKRAGSGFRTIPSIFLAVLEEAGLMLTREDGELQIYRREFYRMEAQTAAYIARLQESTPKFTLADGEIEEIEKEMNIAYAPEQKEAFKLLETPGIKILTGGPGTGKTTVTKGLIHAFRKHAPYEEIILCAPTGCAAKRLSESTGEKARTIHKLLDIRPFEDHLTQQYNETNPLPKGLIIVDEASMVDVELFHMLLRAIQQGSVVILSGDEDQLPSVGKGNVLHDLIEFPAIPGCRLRKTFRVKDGSALFRNIQEIRDGHEENIETGHDFVLVRCRDKEQIRQIVEKKFRYDVTDPFRMRLFSPTKKPDNPCSTVALNNVIHTKYAEQNEAKEYTFGKHKRLSKGDPVICNQNNYGLNVFNGEVGVISAIYEEHGRTRMTVQMEDGPEVELAGTDILNFDPAYAITVHKSQGGECDTAVVVLPQDPGNMLQRSLLYVAVTRAKKKVIVLSEGDAFEKAIRNNEKQQRFTGLKNRLAEIL